MSAAQAFGFTASVALGVIVWLALELRDARADRKRYLDIILGELRRREKRLEGTRVERMTLRETGQTIAKRCL